MPSDLLLFRFMVLFALDFIIGKGEGWGGHLHDAGLLDLADTLS
jgi:hypothetical protein